MHGPLNSFQRTMLDWDALHPYNAVHAVRLPGMAQADRIETALNLSLAARGLTGLSISRKRGTYAFRGGPVRSEVRILAPLGQDASALAPEIERQLNTRFPAVDETVFEPFRFFVVPGIDSFWLGLVYYHPVADGESVLWLMRDLMNAVLGRSPPAPARPLDCYPPRPERLALRRPLRWLRALATLPGSTREIRRARRPLLRDPADGRVRFEGFSLGPECLEAMRAAGQNWGVTFNDLVLAALLRALSLRSRAQHGERRNRIGLGVIVSLRKELGVESRGPFGLMLGSFHVTHEVPGTLGFRELTQAVSRQTRQAKRTRSYLATSAQLTFARCVFARSSPARRTKFYLKHYPMSGGVTNLHLNALWRSAPEEGVLDYVRAVSTGPATPLVLSCTTAGAWIRLGVSYRAAAFTDSELEQVRGEFIRCLGELPAKP
jgi:hypothetical protein